ncbi:unnamed protein product [Linum tenue]|uniref:Uncharacterized protein n=1 Tax=Linum tenue TaxID=586396 RepID=A0AAV0IZD9_9ROSI|nr:unnamed protein product [Linum tenue]
MTLTKANDAMTPISKIFSLDSPENIVGLILVKNLIKCSPENETPIRDLTIRKIPRVNDQLPPYDLLNLFQKGHSDMAAVVKYKDNANKMNAENTRTE